MVGGPSEDSLPYSGADIQKSRFIVNIVCLFELRDVSHASAL